MQGPEGEGSGDAVAEQRQDFRRFLDAEWSGGATGFLDDGEDGAGCGFVGHPEAGFFVGRDGEGVESDPVVSVGQVGRGVNDAATGINNAVRFGEGLPDGEQLAGLFASHTFQPCVDQDDGAHRAFRLPAAQPHVVTRMRRVPVRVAGKCREFFGKWGYCA